MKRTIFLYLGFLFLGIGALGAILPLLPTTPFILLAAFMFSKGSERWYQWLIKLPKFGKSIQDWNEHNIINYRAKIACFISIIAVIIFFSFFTVYSELSKITLGIILVTVLIYVMTRPNDKTHK